MEIQNERRLVLPPLKFLHLRNMLIISIVLISGAIAARFALNSFQEPEPMLITPGWQLANELTTTLKRQPDTLVTSGSYLPGQGVVLYSHISQSSVPSVRTWAVRNLQTFSAEFATLPQDEQLIWVIDYGESILGQEVIVAPVSQAGVSTNLEFMSLPAFEQMPDVAVVETASDVVDVGVEPESEMVEPIEQVTENPGVEDPAPEIIQPIEVIVEPAAAVPEVVTGPTTPTRIFSGRFDNGAVGWLPIAGSWVAENGSYIQNDNSGFDYMTMLDIQPLTHFSIEARIQSLDGNLGGGFVYNAPYLDSRAGAQVIDLIDQGSYLRWGHYNEGGDFVFDGGLPVEPPLADGAWHQLRLVTHDMESVVYIDNEQKGVIANQNGSGFLGLVVSQAQVQFDDVTVLHLPAGVTVYSNEDFIANFDDGSSEAWLPFSGQWEVIDNTYQQTELGTFDLGTSSPFSSDNYQMQARFRFLEGEMGAGFYYNMTNRDSKVGSQMFNFTQQGAAIQWGHFNGNGEFVFEGVANTKDVSDGEWHTLKLTVDNGRSSIILDDEIIVQDIALTYSSGYAGLLVSQSRVAFDDIELVLANQQNISLGESIELNQTYTFDDGNLEDWLAVSGEWALVDGVYEQQQQNEYDRISTLNVKMVGDYRFGTQMLYKEGDMSGGLIFNMLERDSKAQSQMVSFTANGTFLQWGSFDAGGIFNYQGGVPIASVQDGEWHELAVETYGQLFSISIDGQIIAADIPLTYTTGFVGLFDGISHVGFDNVQLSGVAQTLLVQTDAVEEAPAQESESAPDDAGGEAAPETEPVPTDDAPQGDE